VDVGAFAVAAAIELFLVGGYIPIRMAPAPEPSDTRPIEDEWPQAERDVETPARTA
jgi:hypothetical protein